ncbi:MAG: hypothetical protein R3A45_13100 [Bdellovibrionota bacterium]
MESEIYIEKIIGELTVDLNFEYKRLHKEHGDLEEKLPLLIRKTPQPED